MSSITIQIPDYLRKQVETLAAEEGFSVDQFFATAASENLAVLEAVDYIQENGTAMQKPLPDCLALSSCSLSWVSPDVPSPAGLGDWMRHSHWQRFGHGGWKRAATGGPLAWPGAIPARWMRHSAYRRDDSLVVRLPESPRRSREICYTAGGFAPLSSGEAAAGVAFGGSANQDSFAGKNEMAPASTAR